MKKIVLLFAGQLLAVLAQAQTNDICLYYDAAGNRHTRNVCCTACLLSPPGVEDRAQPSQTGETDMLRLSVVPNPTTGVFALSSEDAPPEAPVFIYDAAGKLLIQSRLGAGHFDLSSYPPDVYFVRLVYGQKQKTLRLEKTER
jgi:hypothetical protein